MHGILQTIMWRHRKVHVEHEIVLPPCSVQDVVRRCPHCPLPRGLTHVPPPLQVLDLSPLERSYYDKRHEEVRRLVLSLSRHNTGALAPNVISALTTLRQICCHPQIVRRDDSLLGEDGSRLTMEQIVSRSVCGCLPRESVGQPCVSTARPPPPAPRPTGWWNSPGAPWRTRSVR